MKSQQNIDLEVTQDGLRFAGIYSLKIAEKNARKRVFASLVILNSLADFFAKQNLDVSSTKSLYKASKLSEEFEITDLYVNNWRLDIRLAISDDCFYIPKSHYENEILPDFYVVATIDRELKKPKFIGYAAANKLHIVPYNSLYYKADLNDLGGMSDLINELRQEKSPNFKEKDHRFFHSKILSYFDNEADNFTKSKLLNHLLDCPKCRTELINFCGFDIIAQKLEDFGDLFNDESLNIIGALNAQDDEDEEEESVPEVQDKTGQDELIDGLFEKKSDVAKPDDDSITIKNDSDRINLHSEDNERITINDTDNLLIKDIPSLEDSIKPIKEEIKIEKPKEEAILTFTADDTEIPNKAKVSVAESLLDVLDIPDEMFNMEYDESKISNNNESKRNNHTGNVKIEKVIVDYDELGQPIYKNSSPEDYKIIEEVHDSNSNKENNEQSDITYTYKSSDDQDNIIEGSSEACGEELIPKLTPQKKNNGKAINIMLIILGIVVIALIICFIFMNPFNKSEEMDINTPVIKPPTAKENKIDDVIAKNINSKTGLIKLNGLNWVTQKSLLEDDGFKEYLQNIDTRFKVKFKLNSNSITKAPFNNNVVAEVIVTPDGIIKSSRIAQSSGVKDLDTAIISSLHEALDGLPIPTLTQDKYKLDEYYIKVMIKF